MRAAFEGAILSAGSVRAESAKAPDEPHSELQVPTSPGLGPRKPRHQNAKPELVGCELIGRRCWGRPKRPGEIAHDFRCLATEMAETEGFEPSIGLYNPITV
jgi:hypothetical protein